MRSVGFRPGFRQRPQRRGGAIIGAAIASGVLCAAAAGGQAEPPARDYGAEAIAMIAAAQGAAADGSDNGWVAYQHAVTSIGSAARFFAMSSEALAEYARGGDERFAVDVLSWLSDPEITPDPTGVLAREGERLMQAMDRAGWWEALGPVREARAFVPPRQYGPMLGWSSFPFGRAQQVAWLCAARMRRAMEAGDFENAAIALEDALALTRAMSWTPAPVENSRFSVLRDLLASADQWRGHPGFARSALVALDRQPLAPVRIAVEPARLAGLEMIRVEVEQFVREEVARRRAAGEDVDVDRFWEVVQPVLAPPDEQARRFNEVADAALAVVEARGAAFAPARAQYRDLSRGVDDRLLAFHLAVVPVSEYQRQRLRAREGAVRIALALEIHRAEAGEYPQSLAELEALDALPPDPWSDEPLRYRREADGGVIVYSVGQDGVDDGGRENPERPGAPEEQAPRRMWEGFDVVLYRAPGG